MCKRQEISILIVLQLTLFGAEGDSLSFMDAEILKSVYGPTYHKLVSTVTNDYYQDYGVSEEWGNEKFNY